MALLRGQNEEPSHPQTLRCSRLGDLPRDLPVGLHLQLDQEFNGAVGLASCVLMWWYQKVVLNVGSRSPVKLKPKNTRSF